MHVALRISLDCPIERADDLLHSPAAMRFVMAPWLEPSALTRALPERWPEGEPVALRTTAFGIPAGRITVDLANGRRGDTRIVTDRGRPQSGLLAGLTHWRHRMALRELSDGRTEFLDRLEFRGPPALAVWPTLWALWQWRGHRLRLLASQA